MIIFMMMQSNITVAESSRCEESIPISPMIYKTPLKSCKSRLRHTSCQGSLPVLSNHNYITPPSGITQFIARNPFDADLTNRLHLSVISPTIFSKVSPATQDSPFSWTIDELSNLRPVKIEEFPMQQMHCSDPETEQKAQDAINKFFSENQIHPSPWNERKEPAKPLFTMTPIRGCNSTIARIESQKSTRDSSSQTILSLPPDLPKNVEDALKPYFNFTQDQQADNDDPNSSNNSLRRKLFFNNDESIEDDEDECSFIISPIKGSPLRSGMFVHGTPLGKVTSGMQRTYGTPYNSTKNLSPLNMSPICNPVNETSSHSFRTRCNATRLDFSAHMSVDTSLSDDHENEKPQKSTFDQDEFHTPPCDVDVGEKNTNFEKNETIEMESLSEDSTPLKKPIEKNAISNDIKDNKVDNFGTAFGGNFKPQNATIIGYGEDNSSAQDTGYQTYTMNNTTTNMDNRSITPNKKFNWNERINGMSSIKEMTISDWQENIKSVFSSTPSKIIQRREF